MANDGIVGRWVRWAVAHPVLFLALLCLAQVLPTLASRDYWAYDEVRHAEALRGVLEEGHWLSLHLNGAPYPDKPPLYFWLVAGVARAIGTDGPPAFFLVSGLGGFLLLLATWGLARSTCAKGDPPAALLAPVMVAVTPLFQVLLRTTRMDLLFAAVITWSVTCLGRGFGPAASRRQLLSGFALAGLATLIKGPAGLALPLAAALTYLIWTGQARRLWRWDVGLGVVVALVPILGWAVGLGLVEGWDYLRAVLGGQVVGRTLLAHKHAQPFFQYLLLLPIAFLPWTALLAVVPWRTALTPATWRALARARRSPASWARTWLVCAFAGGFVVLSLATSKLIIYLMPLLPPLAVLGARALGALGDEERSRLFTTVGATLAVAGLLAGGAPYVAARALALPDLPLRGIVGVAAVLLAAGLVVLGWRARRGPAPIVATVLGLLGAYLLLAGVVAPSLDDVMSPRRQAEVIAARADEGYAPLIFRVYPGTYSYYARRPLPETRDLERLRAHVHAPGRRLVVMARKYWDRYAEALPGFRRIHEQRVEGRPFVILLRDDPVSEDGE